MLRPSLEPARDCRWRRPRAGWASRLSSSTRRATRRRTSSGAPLVLTIRYRAQAPRSSTAETVEVRQYGNRGGTTSPLADSTVVSPGRLTAASHRSTRNPSEKIDPTHRCPSVCVCVGGWVCGLVVWLCGGAWWRPRRRLQAWRQVHVPRDNHKSPSGIKTRKKTTSHQLLPKCHQSH